MALGKEFYITVATRCQRLKASLTSELNAAIEKHVLLQEAREKLKQDTGAF
jgi:hypothetical protein